MAGKEIPFPENGMIVSKTDTKGRITYGNELFIKMSGYSEDKLLGEPHNILRHPDMPALVFKHLWTEIQKGNEVHAFVKNKTKDDNFYWVFTTVSPDFDESGKNIVGYYSVRTKPRAESVKAIETAYKMLRGADAEKKLKEILGGKSYEEFILSI